MIPRMLLASAALAAACVAHAARPDPAIYPNANIYREPAAGALVPEGRARIIRESCPGGGRGLVHFLEVDGVNIRVRGTWPTYLELAPGKHVLDMEFKGPGSGPFGQWECDGNVELHAEAGRAYAVRYLRVGKDRFRVWVEAYAGEPFESVGVSTAYCDHAPVADPRLHQ